MSASLTTRGVMAACGGEEEREIEQLQVHFRLGGFLARHILKENVCVKRLERSLCSVCQKQALSSLGIPRACEFLFPSPPLFPWSQEKGWGCTGWGTLRIRGLLLFVTLQVAFFTFGD